VNTDAVRMGFYFEILCAGPPFRAFWLMQCSHYGVGIASETR